MKTKSLNFKIMATFISVILLFALITYTLLIESFQKYYYEDIYRVLEDNDDKNMVIKDIDDFINNNVDDRSIEQLYWVITNDRIIKKTVKPSSDLTEDIIKHIESNIRKQTQPSKRYGISVNGRKLFYVITEHKLDNGNKIIDDRRIKSTVYRVALRWEPLDDVLKKQLFSQMGIGLLIAMLAMLAVFFFLSRYITRPLMQLTHSVKRISKRKFDQPISIRRNDEIGFLANTVEEMRKELLSYDEEQKLKLHSISHELKTPIMIIQSYIDALKKGLYPKGTPESSIEVIDEECERLQKLVFNLLYIQRLDYFESEIKNNEQVNLKEIIEEVIDSISIQLEDISVEIDLDKVLIMADYNQLKIVIENLMSNQIRYAKSIIRISLKKDKNNVYIEFFNNGEPIENEKEIFNMFKKGKKGQSGLGLYIVKRLLSINGGDISAENVDDGVSFVIKWKIK